MPEVVVGEQNRRLCGAHANDGEPTVRLVDSDPAPRVGTKHLAHEPGNDEVVGDQELVTITSGGSKPFVQSV